VIFALFGRETASSYTEELQALKGVEKELGRGRVYVYLYFLFLSLVIVKATRYEGCRILSFTILSSSWLHVKNNIPTVAASHKIWYFDDIRLIFSSTS
jgi:hypothetical protein